MKHTLKEIFNELNDQKYWLTESGPCVIDYHDVLIPLKRFERELRARLKHLDEFPKGESEYRTLQQILGDET